MDIDILESFINRLTGLVWSLEPRLIFLIVRLALLNLNTCLLLIIGRRVIIPTTLYSQILMVFLAIILSLTCSVRAILQVAHGALLWILVLGMLILSFAPIFIGRGLSPDPQMRARISRLLYIIIVTVFLIQSLVILWGKLWDLFARH